jgi:hypothetical protein
MDIHRASRIFGEYEERLVNVTEDLSSDVLSSSLLVIQDAGAGGLLGKINYLRRDTVADWR